MSHNLNFSEGTGKHAFFSVNQKAWHGLGTIVTEYPTSREAIQYAGLDYTVEKSPLFTFNSAKQEADATACITIPQVEVPNYFATMRTDTGQVLGVVGRDYEVVQNRDAFSFFDAIVSGGGIQYETAGALGKGERIFITAKLPNYIEVGKGDLVEQYLFLTTSHDGLGSITAAFTPVRIVCQNTLSAALKNQSNTIRIRHTVGARERLETAHHLMGITTHLSGELEARWKAWAKVRVTDSEVRKLIALALMPRKEAVTGMDPEQWAQHSACYKRSCEEAYTYAMSHQTQQMETTKGTLFGAYNAVTGYFQNVRTYKSGEAKLKSLLLGGTASEKTQKAFDLCTLFARAVPF